MCKNLKSSSDQIFRGKQKYEYIGWQILHNWYVFYLLVRVDDGVEGQTVSPTGGEVFQFNGVFVSAKEIFIINSFKILEID